MNNILSRFTPASKTTFASPALETVCVFCGANYGADSIFRDSAVELGRALADEQVHLVYGGGVDGLMGAVARAAAERGGCVTAVMPHFIARRNSPLPFPHEIIAVPDMHTRKKIMFDRSDAFVALPGGIGTIEELTEIITLHKLEQSWKPLIIANFGTFWDPLLELFAHLRRSGFMCGEALSRCIAVDTPRAILPTLRAAMIVESLSRTSLGSRQCRPSARPHDSLDA